MDRPRRRWSGVQARCGSGSWPVRAGSCIPGRTPARPRTGGPKVPTLMLPQGQQTLQQVRGKQEGQEP